MDLQDIQIRINQIYAERGYTDDLLTLGLGLCEEAGELAKAINQQNPKYKPTAGRKHHTVEHEIADCLVYLFGIASSAGINVQLMLREKLDEMGSEQSNG